jgi:hypothetical protein
LTDAIRDAAEAWVDENGMYVLHIPHIGDVIKQLRGGK